MLWSPALSCLHLHLWIPFLSERLFHQKGLEPLTTFNKTINVTLFWLLYFYCDPTSDAQNAHRSDYRATITLVTTGLSLSFCLCGSEPGRLWWRNTILANRRPSLRVSITETPKWSLLPSDVRGGGDWEELGIWAEGHVATTEVSACHRASHQSVNGKTRILKHNTVKNLPQTCSSGTTGEWVHRENVQHRAQWSSIKWPIVSNFTVSWSCTNWYIQILFPLSNIQLHVLCKSQTAPFTQPTY